MLDLPHIRIRDPFAGCIAERRTQIKEPMQKPLELQAYLIRRLRRAVLHRAAQQTQTSPQFIDCAVRLYAHVRFRYTLTACQRCFAFVSRFGINRHGDVQFDNVQCTIYNLQFTMYNV